jgi:hypothetical protein
MAAQLHLSFVDSRALWIVASFSEQTHFLSRRKRFEIGTLCTSSICKKDQELEWQRTYWNKS